MKAVAVSMQKQSDRQGCLTTLLRLFGARLSSGSQQAELPYGLRDDFLSAAELSFFRVLQQVVGERAVICPKVNLADLFFVKRPNENRSYRNKIDRKHVDFVLCDPKTMAPMCAIELDDSSHSRPDRVERDRFVDEVFEAAHLPLIRIPAARSYGISELNERLQPYLGTISRRLPDKQQRSGTPVCPKCDEPMVMRTATKGKSKGQQFWGCANYPQCKEIIRA